MITSTWGRSVGKFLFVDRRSKSLVFHQNSKLTKTRSFTTSYKPFITMSPLCVENLIFRPVTSYRHLEFFIAVIFAHRK